MWEISEGDTKFLNDVKLVTLENLRFHESEVFPLMCFFKVLIDSNVIISFSNTGSCC